MDAGRVPGFSIARELDVCDRKTLKVVDLFAGCGGLSLGLEQAGFVPVFVNELNDSARDTYIRNRKDHFEWFDREKNPGRPFESSDVKEIVSDPNYLPRLEERLRKHFKIKRGELDLIVGGPPCQGFSGIGHRRSYSVDKEHLPSNHLYQDMAQIIRHLQPRAFLFENVRGLLNAKWNSGGRKIWPDVLAEFASIEGYTVAFQLVYAKHYGVPQNRPRVLLVGIRNDVKADVEWDGDATTGNAVARRFLPEGNVAPPNLQDLLSDLIDPKYRNGMEKTSIYPHPAKPGVQTDLRQGALEAGLPLTEHEYSVHSERIVDKFKAIQEANGGEIPARFHTKKFAQRLLPKRWGKAGPTITATSLPDDYVHFHKKNPRILTVREWARLQMFPDWYQFEGKRTTGGLRRAGNPREGIFDREVPKYTQIGNAVPVALARAVGEHLAKLLHR